MPLNNDEKRCIATAKAFLDDARKEIGLVPWKMNGSDTIAAEGTMLGQMAAQRFETCMRAATSSPKAATKR